jgi:hypothetical protein
LRRTHANCSANGLPASIAPVTEMSIYGQPVLGRLAYHLLDGGVGDVEGLRVGMQLEPGGAGAGNPVNLVQGGRAVGRVVDGDVDVHHHQLLSRLRRPHRPDVAGRFLEAEVRARLPDLDRRAAGVTLPTGQPSTAA